MSGGPVSLTTSGGPVSSPGALGDESPAVVGDVVDGAGGVATDIEDGAGVGVDIAPVSADDAGVGDDIEVAAAVGVDAIRDVTGGSADVVGGVDGALDQAPLTDPACAAVGVDVNGCVTANAVAVADGGGVVGRTGVADTAGVAAGAVVKGSVTADAAAVAGVCGVADLACVADPGVAVGADATGGIEADAEVVGVVGVGRTVACVIGVNTSGDLMADPIGGVVVSLAWVVVGDAAARVDAAANSPRLACASGVGDPVETVADSSRVD